MMLDQLYQPSLALLTDLYQLTMAYGYWKRGLANQGAVFHLFFRKAPFQGGYAVAAGLEQALNYLERFRFDASDLDYLASLTGNDDAPLFEQASSTIGQQLNWLDPTIRRFLNPHEYPLGLDIGLHEIREEMIFQARTTQLSE